jgi:TRAP-type mannitol/chloroaromatic compound transport system permease small subunit
MTKAMRRLTAGIESFIDWIGSAVAWIALSMIGLVALNVMLRYAFSFGSVWGQELEWHLLAALILFGMAFALQRGDNVRVDLFYARYSPGLKHIVDVIAALLTIAVALLFVYLAQAYVMQSYSIQEGSPDPGGIPLRWIVKALIPLGYGLVALQQVAHLMRLVINRGDTKEAARV